MKFNALIIVFSIAIVGIIGFTGCRKKEPTVAKIHVRDSSNQSVEGARVVLYGEPSPGEHGIPILFDTTISNSSGEAVFNFDDVYQLGQAGVAVLNIDVVLGIDAGHGIIKVEQETTSEETVFIQ